MVKQGVFYLCASVAIVCLTVTSASAETLLDAILRFTGIAANPSQLRDDIQGDIWIYSLGQEAQGRLEEDQITAEGGYRSPVFFSDGASVLATRNEALVRVPVNGGGAETLQVVKGIIKIVEFDRADSDRVLVLRTKEGDSLPAAELISLRTGITINLSHDQRSEQATQLVERLLSWNRVYDGTAAHGVITLTVEKSAKTKKGRVLRDSTVNVVIGGRTVRGLHCEGVFCDQPSLSPDGQRIALIKGE